MSLLSEISITVDSREKNQKRINAVTSWAEKHGAIVEVSALPLCDYKIEGTFNEVEMCLGIEAKGLQDFASSYQELPDKLSRAYELYSEVALFIEVGSYTFIPDSDDFHATICNPAVRNGDANILPLAILENMSGSFQHDGIHVRQLRSELHFPYAIANLLISITKPIHSGLHITKDKGFRTDYLNVLGKMPGISFKRAFKLLQNYPNIFWLSSADEVALQEVLGKKTGTKVYEFLRNHELESPEWKKGYHRDGTPKEELTQEEIDEQVKSGIIEYLRGFQEGRNIEEICLHFNLPQGDFDRQTLHDYIKELAVEGKITSIHSGLFVISPENPIPEAMAYDGKPQRYTEIQPNKTDKNGNSLNPEISSYPGTDFSKSPIHESITPPYTVPDDNPQGTILSHSPPILPGDTTSKVSQDKKMSLTEHLKIWFQEPHTLMETQLMYGLEGKIGAWSSKSVFDAVLAGEKSGYLRVFPQKGERYYVVAVKEDKELDIGV